MRRTPLYRLNVAELIAMIREAARLATIYTTPAKKPPVIIPGRPEDFGR